ncbi:crotonase/enoyl-CoA hydratase family protein [Paracraurococcus lichenis]|uniref:Crotonase/enoyl-CoA hydratase family protein n=1 Tax=Paracraurococcus lichenis TaxID=3064888 RepID=A0ABT9DXD1_9PROT|nr:crotonase/enoyl-CoA hydratase family protein [Paracraurococcus sp. LOR1-02]MDO9708553.1 crotonase/enoyl-CoA hydratase family protein [Paracraurococcus sp. LOR1-02]
MTFVRSPMAAAPSAIAHPALAQISLSARSASTHETLDTAYDAERGVYWCRLRPTGRPCFSRELLRDIASMHAAIPELFAADAPLPPPRWFVCGSAIPGIYNLGGDLGLFRELIAAGDREGLVRYGHAAVEAIHRNHTALELPMITVALVQGDALGGGFECALAHDIIVAERSAKFGLPEVLFNLFPGMGAYSFLSRRLGRAAAETLILSGEVHTAEQMHAMGLVDVLAEDGEGEAALHAFIDKQDRFHNARQAMLRARRKVDPVTLAELREVVEVWAEAALRLSEQDLRRMARLCGAQDRRMGLS